MHAPQEADFESFVTSGFVLFCFLFTARPLSGEPQRAGHPEAGGL